MPAISLQKISKSFGSQSVLRDLDLEIADREFLVLLGPSGCGKSTLLRVLAGLTDATSGRVAFDGNDVTATPADQRNVAFVFQSYALYPHMTVRQNIAFPLVMAGFRAWYHLPLVGWWKRRRLAGSAPIADEVARVAEIMGLTSLLDRHPKALSGGQRQRVAVARALVKDPTLYLLDEPLSNLDAQLRTQMRAEISALYRSVKKSFVYVTHDQVEAMTMGTRIVVLDRGVVQQCGTPQDIYDRPANTFVARFVGSPPMNLFTCTVEAGRLRTVQGGVLPLPVPRSLQGQARIVVGIRSEDLLLSPCDAADAGEDTLRGWVAWSEQLGAETVTGFHLVPPASHGPEAVSYTHLTLPTKA